MIAVATRGIAPQVTGWPPPPLAQQTKLLLTVEETAQRLSIGRPKMYQLVMRGEVVSIKIGASRRIPVAALEAYVTRLSAQAEDSGRAGDIIAEAQTVGMRPGGRT